MRTQHSESFSKSTMEVLKKSSGWWKFNIEYARFRLAIKAPERHQCSCYIERSKYFQLAVNGLAFYIVQHSCLCGFILFEPLSGQCSHFTPPWKHAWSSVVFRRYRIVLARNRLILNALNAFSTQTPTNIYFLQIQQ